MASKKTYKRTLPKKLLVKERDRNAFHGAMKRITRLGTLQEIWGHYHTIWGL